MKTPTPVKRGKSIFPRKCWAISPYRVEHASEDDGKKNQLSLLHLLASNVLSLFGDGAFHQQHQNHEDHSQDGAQPKDIEVCERRRLLLAKVVERLEAQQSRSGRIAGALQE